MVMTNKLVKKKKKIQIILTTIVVMVFIVTLLLGVWGGGSQKDIELQRYHMDVPGSYSTCALEEGVIFKQGFIPGSKYFYGIEVLLINLSESSNGSLIVQICDDEGKILNQKEVLLSDIEPGQYTDILMGKTKVEPENKEYQICMFTEGIENIEDSPYLLIVADEDDLDQNSTCYYNDEMIADNAGSMMGYIYGDEGEIVTWYQLNQIKSVLIVLLGICAIYVVYILRLPQGSEIKAFVYNYRVFYQYSIICIFASLFCLCATIGKDGEGYTIPIWMMAIWGLTILLLTWTYCSYRKVSGKQFPLNWEQIDKCEWVIAIVCILSRIPMFGTPQKWDAGIYYGGIYRAASNFDFSISSIWNHFKLAGHPAFIYTFFVTMGEFLFPGKEIGVHIVNLCLTTAAMICIYRMFCNYWCRMSKGFAMIATILISLFPVYWGTFTQFNIDYPLLLFFVFLLYAEYKDQKVMMAFWTVALLLTKETGWFIVAGYYVAYIVNLWCKVKKECLGEKIQRICADTMVRLMVIGVIFAGLFLLKQGGVSTWGNAGSNMIATKEVVERYGADVAGFYFYRPYIFHKLAQIFMLNFMWILTLIIIIALFIKIVKRVHKKEVQRFAGIGGILGGFVAFLLFSTFYLTHAISRYVMLGAGVVGIIAMVLFWQEIFPILRKRKSIMLLMCIISLLVIQNFIYIDPVSNLIFDKKDSGRGNILSVNLNIPRADTFTNSYRFAYIDSLLDQMLAEVDYQSDTQVIRFHNKKEQSFINGFGGYELEWDKVRKKRVFACKENKSGNSNLTPITIVMFEDIEENGTGELADKILIYFMPIFSIDQEESLAVFRKDYDIGEKNTVANWGGTLDYYILTRKE